MCHSCVGIYSKMPWALSLEVHGKPIHIENSAKYMGDIFHTNGKTNASLVDRCAKVHAILADICATLQDLPLFF